MQATVEPKQPIFQRLCRWKMTAAVENPPTPETQTDDEENTRISAGYTYFGQFIDHDLTFDPASLANALRLWARCH